MRRSLAAVMLAWLLLAPAAALGVERGVFDLPVREGRSVFPGLKAVGARYLVTPVYWSQIAPTRPKRPGDPADPAYRWQALDAVVADARRHRIELIPSVEGTPRWANGGRAPAWSPNDPRDYARFMAAMSRRYPSIRRWFVWGEPSKALRWRPQGIAGARRYARLLDLTYTALKRVRARNVVIGGNTYCCGRDDRTSTSARTWLARMRLPNGRRPRLDQWGMNPYGSRRVDLRQKPLNRLFMDFNDMDTLAALLDAAYPRKRVRIFIGEIGIPSDHPNVDFTRSVSRREQARRLTAVFRAADRFKRIAAVTNFLLFDQPAGRDRATGFPTDWTTGLLTQAGRRKPVWTAFRRG